MTPRWTIVASALVLMGCDSISKAPVKVMLVEGDHLKHADSPLLASAPNFQGMRDSRPEAQFHAREPAGTEMLYHTVTGNEIAAYPGPGTGAIVNLRRDYFFHVSGGSAYVERYGDAPTYEHELRLKDEDRAVVQVNRVYGHCNLARRWANATDWVILDAETTAPGKDGTIGPPKRELWRLKIKAIEDCLNRAP